VVREVGDQGIRLRAVQPLGSSAVDLLAEWGKANSGATRTAWLIDLGAAWGAILSSGLALAILGAICIYISRAPRFPHPTDPDPPSV